MSELGLPLLGAPHEELPPHPSVLPEASAEIPASLEAIRDGWEGWKKLAQLCQAGAGSVMGGEAQEKGCRNLLRRGDGRASSVPMLGGGGWAHPFVVKEEGSCPWLQGLLTACPAPCCGAEELCLPRTGQTPHFSCTGTG